MRIVTTAFEVRISSTIKIAVVFAPFPGATGLIIKAKTLLNINTIEGITLLTTISIASAINKSHKFAVDEQNMYRVEQKISC